MLEEVRAITEKTEITENQRFQLVIDELNAAVFEWNFEDGSFYCSKAYEKYAISQVKSDDILHNRGPADIVYEDDQEVIAQFFSDMKSGKERVSANLRLKMTDGSFRWCRMVALFYSNTEGRRNKAIGIILDINDEHEHSFMLDSLINGIPGGVAIFKFVGKLVCEYYSDGFAQLLGRTRDEIDDLLERGRLFKTVIAPSDVERFIVDMRENTAKNYPVNKTYRYIVKDKGVGWLHLAARKLREEDGYPVYYCVFTNATDETAAYRNIVEGSAIGVFVADRKEKRILYMNERMGELFGVPKTRLMKRVDNYDQLPEEYTVMKKEDVLALREDVYSEFHVVWKNKLHLGINARALKWNGIDAYIMYFKDETAEYEHQIQLQKLIDEVPTGIGIYEIRDGKLAQTYMNDAFYDMQKETRESHRQYMGESVNEAVYPEDRAVLDAYIRKLYEGIDKTTLQLRLCNGEGVWRWMQLAVSVIERRENFVKMYVAFSDCDEMMRTQQELQNYRVRLDAALTSAHVLEWEYDFRTRTITDSGALGISYNLPKVIENVPDVFLKDNLDIICDESIEDLRWMADHCADGKRIERDIRCKTPDGKRIIWQRMVYTPIFDSNGNCVEMIGTAVDITEQKEREQHYEEQLRLNKIASRHALATATFNLTQNRVIEAESMKPELTDIIKHTKVDMMLKDIRKNACKDEAKLFKQVYDAEAMINEFEIGNTHIEVRHHLKSSDWVETTFDIIQNPYNGDIEAIATLTDISDTVRAELIVNRLLEVDYEAIMTIDKETGMARAFRQDEENKLINDLVTMLENQGSVDGRENFYEKYVVSEDKERAYKENSLEYIVAALEKTPIHISLFSLNIKGKVRRQRSAYAYLDDSRTTILCAVQDVTEAYEQEEKQKNDLTVALRAAEYANQSRRDFLARMSHDMRTPMNGIIGVAELSAYDTDPAVLRENMSKIKESGKYLLSLINDTLDFQKIEGGKLTLKKQVVNSGEIFYSVVDMIRPAAEEKGVELQITNHNADMNTHIYIDPVRIKQIIFNLLSNAVKFTPKDGNVSVDVWNISREDNTAHICIKVADTGIGMSRDFIENDLYKPFSQEQRELNSQYVGSGLGLSIVHSLIEMMGGTIEVESEPGKGTAFILHLDIERVDGKEVEKLKEDAKNKRFILEKELYGKHVLLVEDHPLNAQIAMLILEKAGCKVTWMDNGEKGVQEFASSEINSYDAILMDVQMPVMNGLKATAAIRKLNRADAEAVPIIAMTANAYDEDIKKSLEAGMNAHLAKPISPAILSETLVKFMNQTH